MNEATKYRKKPVVIEATQWNGTTGGAKPIIDWMRANGGKSFYYADHPEHIFIETLEGDMHAAPGDFIIRGVQGEFYPCKPDMFEATYEAVEAPELSAAERVRVEAFGIHPELDETTVCDSCRGVWVTDGRPLTCEACGKPIDHLREVS